MFSSARPRRIKADDVLFVAGDAGDGCYRVEDGLLKAMMVSRFGNERILAFLGPGAVVGEESIIDGRPRSASVVAVRDSVLSFLGRGAFEDFVQEHPEVYKSMAALLASRLREIEAVVAAESFLPPRGRVAYTLLKLAEHFGQNAGSGRVLIRQKIGQHDLAAMTGVVRETVNRTLSEWKRNGVVSRLAGYYCLDQKAILQKEADMLDGFCGGWPSSVPLADVSFTSAFELIRPTSASTPSAQARSKRFSKPA